MWKLLVTRACFPFSLLEEDYEEEEDLCRICQIAGGSPTNPLLEPCGCVGSLQFVHQECLKKWLKVKITSGRWGRKSGKRVTMYIINLRQHSVSLGALSAAHSQGTTTEPRILACTLCLQMMGGKWVLFKSEQRILVTFTMKCCFCLRSEQRC
jgi:hypothetical protein